jgi:type IV pilus assembly protein PilM
MYLSEKTPLVAVDIGTHSIKIAQLLPSRRGKHELLSFGLIPLKEDSIIDGVVKNYDDVVDTLVRLLKVEKVQTRFAVASLAGEAVIIKKIQVPVMSKEELEENIYQEAEQYIPFDIDDVSIDFHILGSVDNALKEDENAGETMEILLVAVQKEMIYNRTDVLTDAGLKPVIIDLDVFAIENAANMVMDLKSMGAVALIDLGESFTHINIMMNGVTTYTRDIPIGGGYGTRRLMSKFEIPYVQAGEFKAGKIPSSIEEDSVIAVMTHAFSKLLEEVQKCFEFFSTTSNTEVGRVLLCGGGSLVRGVEGFFADQLKIPVEILDPMKGLKVSSKKFDQATIEEMAPMATVAVGLATRRFDYK